MSEIQEIKKPTIQERIQKRVHEILEPIEVWLDRYVVQPDKFNPDKFKLVDVFKKEQVGGVHARKIMEIYEPQYQEYKELLRLREKNLKFKEITEEEEKYFNTKKSFFITTDYLDNLFTAGKLFRPLEKRQTFHNLNFLQNSGLGRINRRIEKFVVQENLAKQFSEQGIALIQ